MGSSSRIGSTRRGYAAGAALAGLGTLGLCATLVSNNALAVDLSAASGDTVLHLDGLSGRAVGIAATTRPFAQQPGDATTEDRARLGIKLDDITLNGLCVISTHPIPLAGEASMVITAGEPVDGRLTGQDPLSLDTLTFDVSKLSGDAYDIDSLVLGQSADQVPGGLGRPGEFGLAVERIRFENLTLHTGALDVVSGINLPHMKIRAVPGRADRKVCG